MKEVLKSLKEWLGGLIDILTPFVAIGVLVEVLFGQGVFGVSIIENLTGVFNTFSTNGFAGLLALLVLLFVYKNK
tara:strand:+ start:985 stop:1209 length:225 start_codon:yes stop_codon:yes gene_type:complete